MKRYEYKTVKLHDGMEEMNRLGREGWLMCGYSDKTGIYMFVREIEAGYREAAPR